MTSDVESSDKTRVDLGEDLLEKTAILSLDSSEPVPTPAQPPASETTTFDRRAPSPGDSVDVDDLFKSAEILMGEGFLEEAKKLLRKIILTDPRFELARIKLSEIHELELKQIFNETPPRFRARRTRESTPPESGNLCADDVIRQLDHDLGLGMAQVAELSIFQNNREMDQFAAALDAEYAGASPRDRIDGGIAFLEMGLFELACRHFKAAMQTPEFRVEALSLWAFAMIQARKAFDAVLELEAAVADTDVPEAEKLELFYLMGRAHEELGNRRLAKEWYEQARALDSQYRDIEDRVRALAEQ